MLLSDDRKCTLSLDAESHLTVRPSSGSSARPTECTEADHFSTRGSVVGAARLSHLLGRLALAVANSSPDIGDQMQ